MAEGNGFWSRARRGWQAFWGSLSPSPPSQEPPLPAGTRTPADFEPPLGSEVLPVAARGDVFDLHLIPYFRWSSDDMDFGKLSSRSLQYVEPARGRLLREIWKVARNFGAADLAAAEKAINELPSVRDGWCYFDDEGTIRCTPSVRAVLDPRLRDFILPFEQRRLEQDAAHKYSLARLAYVEELTERWLQVIKRIEAQQGLTQVERQFLAPFAASLADRDFSVVMHTLAGRRQEKANDLVAVLEQASKSHDSVGLFEFAKAYDKAVEAFSRQLGLDPYRWNLHDMNKTEAE